MTAVGPGLTGRSVGDVVAYGGNPMGSYTEEQILPASVVVSVPSSIDPIVGGSVMLKGMAAWFLLRQCFKANALGATVIGTVSIEEKAAQAKEDGCHHIIIYTQKDFVAAVSLITSGKGVDVVYNSLGKDTFQGSLTCLKTCGYMVSFGQSSNFPTNLLDLYDWRHWGVLEDLRITYECKLRDQLGAYCAAEPLVSSFSGWCRCPYYEVDFFEWPLILASVRSVCVPFGDDRSNEDVFEAISSAVCNPLLPAVPEIFACTVGQKPSWAEAKQGQIYYLNCPVQEYALSDLQPTYQFYTQIASLKSQGFISHCTYQPGKLSSPRSRFQLI
ncbi:hypothetical protein IFM89_010826 [Coptis chinensis]|uniref:Alcohol dehydrogenase-like C-terminal domain-containing protein n=1 Tax=Coptis chinensis TaxID=261450 RepID=A0A835LZC6_9MAGN|nr:hypothetical protein IFM89_010826 [Coptis chinensis]